MGTRRRPSVAGHRDHSGSRRPSRHEPSHQYVEVTREPAKVWSYGINEHLGLTEVPATWQPTGVLRMDYAALCTIVGAFPHPAFRPRVRVVRVERRHSVSEEPHHPPPGRRRSITSAAQAQEKQKERMVTEEKYTMQTDQEAHMVVRSTLLDLASVNLAAKCLLHVQGLRSLSFTDCRLDLEMLQQLRLGLSGHCSVESLQLEWNPLDLPLLSAEAVALPFASEASDDNSDDNSDSAERLERRRYLCEVALSLGSFRNWLADLAGSWEAALQRLEGQGRLSLSRFQDLLDQLGAVGPHVAEVFHCFDAPDLFVDGRDLLASLRQALQDVPEDFDKHFPQNGTALAAFLDGDCILEALSLRSCNLGLAELRPLSVALERQPWQLRSLNLWENRICDRGAALLATGFESYRGLEYLGLGRNRLTERGLAAICAPFQAVFLDQAGYEAAAERLRAAAAQQEAEEKAAAKAKAKEKEEPKAGHRRRHAAKHLEELEELPVGTQRGTARGSDRPAWVLRRPNDLQCLNASENPIKDVKAVELLQPQGQGAELVLRGTPAAAAILARPLSTRERKGARDLSGSRGEGWVFKLTY